MISRSNRDLKVLLVPVGADVSPVGRALEAVGFQVVIGRPDPPHPLERPTIVLVGQDDARSAEDLVKAFPDAPIALLADDPEGDLPPEPFFECIPPDLPPDLLAERVRAVCHWWSRVSALKDEVRLLDDLQRVGELAYLEYEAVNDRLRCSSALIDLIGAELRSGDPSLADLLGAVYPDDQAGLQETFQRSLTHGIPFEAEFRVLSDGGAARFMRARGVALHRSGRPTRLFCVIENVTALHERMHQAELRSHLDPLTGLGNRTFLNTRARRLLDEATRDHSTLALLYMDLDGFKLLNDSLGHEMGDLALVTASARLIDTLRASDLICRDLGDARDGALVSRIGGDEFTILLPGLANAEQATAVSNRIQAALARPIELGGHTLSLRASIGVAIHPEHGRTVDELVRNADMALYDAKRSGRSQCRIYSPLIDSRNRRQLLIESQLRKALDEDRLELHFQPRVNVSQQQIVGVEALLRWTDSELGALRPAEIVSVAEVAGLMPEVGLWVQRSACRAISALDRRFRDALLLSVNVSPAELECEDFARRVIDVLRSEDVTPSRFEIEITEAALLDDSDVVHRNLQELSAVGVRIALDDFGTGQSALRNLTSLPLHTLKLDECLTHQVGSGTTSERLAAHVVRMALEIGLWPVAEAVTTDEQVAFFEAVGCVEMQGFRMSPPLTIQELGKLLTFSRFSTGAPAPASEARDGPSTPSEP
jgi:diguanylate cyclase (GGDEF)-like protein